jgi:hypothetical protein
VYEHVLAAIVADDETESLLRIEKFDDALAFADDLRRHPAAAASTSATEAAAPAAAAAIATAAAAAASTAAAKAAAVTETTASEATAVTEATAGAAGKTAALLVTTLIPESLFPEEFALVATTPAAVPLAPSIETHEPSVLFFSPPTL